MTLNLTEFDKEIFFERFGGGTARLISMAYDQFTDADLNRIVQLCNQKQVKQWVTYQYATGPEGRYLLDDAKYFVESSKQEWHAGTRSSYLIRDEDNMIVGSMSIKTPENSSAEIGYWSDTEGRKGFMTNALNVLIDVAKREGFCELYTLVMPKNEASKNLSSRAGFKQQGTLVKNENRILYKFVRKLA